jgi:hypothetical protein
MNYTNTTTGIDCYIDYDFQCDGCDELFHDETQCQVAGDGVCHSKYEVSSRMHTDEEMDNIYCDECWEKGNYQ